MNERNPEGKDIRFIDSHYKDLFRIPDGGCVQIHYPDETVIKPCVFIDEYHTRVGYNVFHICQFAEIMERNGATYMAEPAIMGDEAAWRVGKDMILALQVRDEGYDYTLCDINFNEVDGGLLDNPELSMIEARTQILESFDLDSRDLRAMIYEEVMEQVFENGRQAAVVDDPIAELAFKLDRFSEDFDPYDYKDQVEDPAAHVQQIQDDLRAGNFAPYRTFLENAVMDAQEKQDAIRAGGLLKALEKVEQKPSVREHLAKLQEQAPAAKPSRKHKEPERKGGMKMSQEKIERWNEVNGNDAPQDKLTAFLDSATDSYAILQLRRTEDTIMERFESMASLHRQGKEPEFDHYEVVYVGDLPPYTNQNMMLESLYEKFNIDHPSDFRGHSLSVSDIVALKTAGVVSCHYVDSIGFAELPGFMRPENYLKNAEMAMEDDYGMIDGVINNGKAAATEERKSVLEQLKDTAVAEPPHKSSRRPKERDLE